MTFPVILHIAGHPIPVHEVCELAGYIVGVQTFLFINRANTKKSSTPGVFSPTGDEKFWLILWCALGAMIGSKLLAWLEMSPDQILQIHNWLDFLGGKTIVGGLLGGWIAVEIAKKYFHITDRTGDGYVAPLVLGIAIGRIGCFLTGLPDHTYGIATSLPWGIDFGDGIRRHPTQLYEIAFVLLWGSLLWLRSAWPHRQGDLFRLFMLGYFTFRLLVEFIKPVYRPDDLSAIQWACLAGIAFSVHGLMIKRPQLLAPEVTHAAT
jgi:phosphatidylglycerol:prolipoprotein diacylglycerol transferase